jgi:hypothetical protein
MWTSFSPCSTGFKEVSKVKEVNSLKVINAGMKTFISPTRQAVFLKKTLNLSAHICQWTTQKSMVRAFMKSPAPQSVKL